MVSVKDHIVRFDIIRRIEKTKLKGKWIKKDRFKFLLKLTTIAIISSSQDKKKKIAIISILDVPSGACIGHYQGNEIQALKEALQTRQKWPNSTIWRNISNLLLFAKYLVIYHCFKHEFTEINFNTKCATMALNELKFRIKNVMCGTRVYKT